MEKGKKTAVKTLAIVGGGPRGLSALESIYGCLASGGESPLMLTLLFEKTELPGAGQVYDINQPDTNWLNVSERGLTIPRRKEIKWENKCIPPFPSYQDWAGYESDGIGATTPDRFPLRSTLGKYLNERYNSIADALEEYGLLKLIKGQVTGVEWEKGRFEIKLEDGTLYFSEELLITIGHQPTRRSDQLATWSEYVMDKEHIDLILEPYPIADIYHSKGLGKTSRVALRGFGLAMIDVMRALTEGVGGKFELTDFSSQQVNYVKSGKEPQAIIPFSLDGLPMAPKLLNPEIDAWFIPSAVEKEVFGDQLAEAARSGNATNIHFLIEAIAPIITRIYTALGARAFKTALSAPAIENTVKAWLIDERFTHALLVPKSQAAEKTLESFIAMATGDKPASLDFCAGHVWRHCQPTMYKALSFSNLDEEIIASVIDLDERLKRYSYGPPVASLQQLLALIKADIVTLDFVKDPEIEMTDAGWKLNKNEDSILADLMINSVLDPPKLLEVESAIVGSLLHESLVKPIHSELGIDTRKDGTVLLPTEKEFIPLAVLGRISKGTLIGVDAILECFGERSGMWAEGVKARLGADQKIGDK